MSNAQIAYENARKICRIWQETLGGIQSDSMRRRIQFRLDEARRKRERARVRLAKEIGSLKIEWTEETQTFLERGGA